MKKEKLTLKILFRIAKGQESCCCQTKTNENPSKKVKALKSCCRLKK